jgi:hypothetical protein
MSSLIPRDVTCEPFCQQEVPARTLRGVVATGFGPAAPAVAKAVRRGGGTRVFHVLAPLRRAWRTSPRDRTAPRASLWARFPGCISWSLA